MNKTDILITIGIAAYNCQRFIGEALKSALQQSHQNLEILIYNDASTDNTQSILNSYNDPRIRVIQGLHNQGVAHARQTIKQQAKGEYLTWLDSDDVFDTKRLSILLECAETKSYDLVIDSYNIIDEKGQRQALTKKIPSHLSADANFTRLFERNFMPAHPLINKNCFRNVDYDLSLRTSEDYDYWLKCSLAGFTFKHLDQLLMNYRITSGSLSSDPLASREATYKILNKYKVTHLLAVYQSRNIDQATQHYMACMQHIFRKEFCLALKYAKHPWPIEPDNDLDFYRGSLYLALNQVKTATQHLKAHLNKYPDSVAGLNNFGLAQKKLGLPAQAYWQQALDIFPNYQDAQRNLQDQDSITLSQIQCERLR
ncbi:glycosyltransferase [Agarivorans sp. QJM3NY_33]|uniref:glycosyltransferase n=1 Tax=Agarivorans sp. QJM3NY_33 TaxID=3421432 RepID=UPI003D7E22E3